MCSACWTYRMVLYGGDWGGRLAALSAKAANQKMPKRRENVSLGGQLICLLKQTLNERHLTDAAEGISDPCESGISSSSSSTWYGMVTWRTCGLNFYVYSFGRGLSYRFACKIVVRFLLDWTNSYNVIYNQEHHDHILQSSYILNKFFYMEADPLLHTSIFPKPSSRPVCGRWSIVCNYMTQIYCI